MTKSYLYVYVSKTAKKMKGILDSFRSLGITHRDPPHPLALLTPMASEPPVFIIERIPFSWNFWNWCFSGRRMYHKGQAVARTSGARFGEGFYYRLGMI